MAAPVQTGLTIDDLQQIEQHDGRRYELIDGALYVSPAPRLRHQWVVLRVGHLLMGYVEEHGGAVFPGPNVTQRAQDLVIPDVVLCSAETLARIGDFGIDVPPDLVVEVSSPSTRRYDLVIKRAHYARIGAVEHWFVDLDADRVEVSRLAESGYAPSLIVERGGVIEPPHLPDLAVAVDDVLRGYPTT